MAETTSEARGRGGFRDTELRTVPENVTRLRATNLNEFRPAQIMTNYVPIIVKSDCAMHRYRVDFEPNIESESHRRDLFRQAAKKFFLRIPAFDGVHEARSREKHQNLEPANCVYMLGGNDNTCCVKFTFTGTASTGPEMLRSYNMELKGLLRKVGFFEPQRGLHVHPDNSHPVGQELRILRGFRTSANIHDQNKLLMNFEGSHKLMQTRNVLMIMHEIRERSSVQRGDFREAIRTQLAGKIVITSYKKRVYRVEDVDFDSNPNTTFVRTAGEPGISFAKYLEDAHNVGTTDLRQPLLIVVPNNNRRRSDDPDSIEIKLVPEHCNIAGLTDTQRNDTNIKRLLITESQVAPQDRVDQLQTFLRVFHSNKEVQSRLVELGYSYNNEPLKITGHVIAPTRITTNPQQEGLPTDQNTAEIKNVRSLAVAPTIQKMVIIVNRQDVARRGVYEQLLEQAFSRIGLRVNQVERHDMTDGDSPAHYVRMIKSLTPPVSVALIIIPSQNKNVYDAIKKVASSELGLVTQVVTSRLLSQQNRARSAAVKIAIQVAAKVGGEPWWADIPLKRTMICGYDTYHDTASRGRSFGAFLASINERYSRWYSKADTHDRLDEMSTQIATNVLEALNFYRSANKNQLPEKIIIYRDGVGEGQIDHVFRLELQAIAEKVKSVSKDIKLTMILVNKRIGARFFLRSQDNRFVNPIPGTVVDHTVTRSERFDFYLISQSTTRGTIIPTYYNIIHDESAFSPEIHQKLAYKLCLLYYNWSGSVRVPAPCQYAHKLAYLCGEHLHSQPSATLSDKLHFL